MSKKTLRRKFLFENKAFDGKTLKGCNCKKIWKILKSGIIIDKSSQKNWRMNNPWHVSNVKETYPGSNKYINKKILMKYIRTKNNKLIWIFREKYEYS